MLAALYIRVSTDEQVGGYSISTQKERLEAFCRSQDWGIFSYYIDDGYSGKDFNRPAIQRLLADAKDRRFNVVVCWRLDRFSRRALDVLRVVEELLEPNNIALRSATEPIDTSTIAGKMMLTMLAAFAQYERESIALRVKVNLRHKASMGLWCGGFPPFGFDQDKGHLTPNSKKAPFVREMFLKCIAGSSALSITRWLNENAILTSTGKKWTAKSVLAVLTNPVYTGNHFWNKTYHTATRKVRRPQSEWIEVQNTHDAIVTEQEFNLAQTVIKDRSYSRSHSAKYSLLAGLVYCGRCGEKYRFWRQAYNPNKAHYYRCSSAAETGKSCGNPGIRQDALESYVVAAVKTIGESAREFDQVFRAKYGDKQSKIKKDFAELDKKLAKLEERKKNNWELVEENRVTKEDFEKRIKQINGEIELVLAEKASKEADYSQMVNRELFFNLVKAAMLKVVREWDKLDQQKKFEILHLIVKEIVVRGKNEKPNIIFN